MASAMRKMAVYLGLVEDDHRYSDQYDYGEYEDYDDQPDRPERPGPPDEADGRGVRAEEAGSGGRAARTMPATLLPTGVRSTRRSRPIWHVSPHCTPARTMRPGPLANTSAT